MRPHSLALLLLLFIAVFAAVACDHTVRAAAAATAEDEELSFLFVGVPAHGHVVVLWETAVALATHSKAKNLRIDFFMEEEWLGKSASVVATRASHAALPSAVRNRISMHSLGNQTLSTRLLATQGVKMVETYVGSSSNSSDSNGFLQRLLAVPHGLSTAHGFISKMRRDQASPVLRHIREQSSRKYHLVVGALIAIGAYDVAYEAQLPLAIVSPFFSPLQYMPMMGPLDTARISETIVWDENLPLSQRLKGAAKQIAIGVLAKAVFALRLDKLMFEPRQDSGKPFWDLTDHMKGPILTLAPAVYGISEDPIRLPGHVRVFGYLPPSGREQIMDASLTEWFAKSDKPVLFASLGTVVSHDVPLITRIMSEGFARGARDGSFRVLWASVASDLPSLDRSKLPGDDVFRFVRFAPQHLVLASPKTKVFFSQVRRLTALLLPLSYLYLQPATDTSLLLLRNIHSADTIASRRRCTMASPSWGCRSAPISTSTPACSAGEESASSWTQGMPPAMTCTRPS